MKSRLLNSLCLLLMLSGAVFAQEPPIDTIPQPESRVVKVTLPTARGNRNERMVSFRIFVATPAKRLTKVDIEFKGTTRLKDFSAVQIWFNQDHKRFLPESAELFGKASPNPGVVSVYGNQQLTEGWNYIWITADISPTATEGNVLEISPISCVINGKDKEEIPQVRGNRPILLTHTLLYSSGDYGSKNFRIPAVVEARDGSLVTLTDKRWSNPFDLPRHIDLLCRRSTDKGATWSEPITVAGMNTYSGSGDAALLSNQKTGELFALYASGQGFFTSSRSNPIRIMKITSQDHGITWSQPSDLTADIYGFYCENPLTNRWQGAFVSSGNLTQLRSGRILDALVVRESTDLMISNYVMYSDDHGQTWQVSPNRVATNGNEAKIIELDNGHLLMSIRNKGFRRFSKSFDQGMTWTEPWLEDEILDPSCNGSITRFSATRKGDHVNRILHSIPFATDRQNLTILISYDEGSTWPVKKTIYSGNSAYSSMTVLKDGTIGLYYEVGEYDIYQLYFARFSLEWLTNGLDHRDDHKTTIFAEASTPASKTEFAIYPNPASSGCTLKGAFFQGDQIQIISVAGVLQETIEIHQETSEVSLTIGHLAPGAYWIRHNQEVLILSVL